MGLLDAFSGSGPSLTSTPPAAGGPNVLTIVPTGDGPSVVAAVPAPAFNPVLIGPPQGPMIQATPSEPNHGAPRPQGPYLNVNGEARHTAFSAIDIHAMVVLPGGAVRSLGNLAALSISSHRDAFPVATMGAIAPRGFTQGHRTVAGTLMFHTLDRNAFGYGLNPRHAIGTSVGSLHNGLPHPDTLPLFDIHISYVNETGQLSFEALYGVRLLDFGKTVSLDNLHPIESYSYMALDYSPMEPVTGGSSPKKDGFRLARPSNRDRKRLKLAEAKNDALIYDPTQLR